jgi:hypothetical protein
MSKDNNKNFEDAEDTNVSVEVSITITIDGSEHRMSIDEAKRLLNVLQSAIGACTNTPSYPNGPWYEPLLHENTPKHIDQWIYSTKGSGDSDGYAEDFEVETSNTDITGGNFTVKV